MIGYAKSVKDNVQPCTREQLHASLDSPHVAEACQAIAEALHKHQQGEMPKEEFEALKASLKKQLPIITPHATFKNGRRKNDEAIPSGLAMYDLDHIADPRARWAQIEPRKEELGIVMAHITPSTVGLRLIFMMQQGHSLAQAQAWMASQLGDTEYDSCVKDYARCSFLVPRAYILYMNEEGLFNEELRMKNEELRTNEELIMNEELPSEDEKNSSFFIPHSSLNSFPEEFEEIPYSILVQTLEEQMGGAPEHGSRNNFIFSMACHLRYVTNDDAQWIAQILPTYGEAIGKMDESDEEVFKTKGPQNLLDLLPEVFTREEAQLMRLHQGIREGNVRLMLSNWKKRGYIEEYGTVMPQSEVMHQRYIKTASYQEKHPQVA